MGIFRNVKTEESEHKLWILWTDTELMMLMREPLRQNDSSKAKENTQI